MDAVIPYLADNPLVALLLAVLAISILWSLLKRLLKLAMILAVVFLSSSGATYHFAQLDLAEKGKELLQDAERTIRKHLPVAGDTSNKTLDSLR